MMRNIHVAGATCALALLALSPATAGEVSAPTDACPSGVLTLSLLRAQNNLPTDPIIDKWEAANPCVTIDVTEVPFGQLSDRIMTLASASNVPDILSYDGPDTASYAAAGILLPLDGYLGADLIADITAATRNEHTWDGKLYSPGSEQATLALFYNKDMTDAAGITPPSSIADAWTWDEAMAAFAACQKGPAGEAEVWGLAPSRFGSGAPGFAYRDLLFLRTAGDPEADPESSAYKTYFALSPDGKTVDGWLNTPEAVAGAQLFQDMFNAAGITPKAGIPNAFQDQKACFTIDMQYLAAGLIANDPGFAWGITPLPHINAPIVHTGSLTMGVTSKSTNPDEAAKFVIDMSTGELAIDYLRSSGSLPVLNSLIDAMPEYKEPPYAIFAEELVAWGQPRPPGPKFTQYNRVVSDALRDIAFGADPKSTLDAAVATLTPILAE